MKIKALGKALTIAAAMGISVGAADAGGERLGGRAQHVDPGVARGACGAAGVGVDEGRGLIDTARRQDARERRAQRAKLRDLEELVAAYAHTHDEAAGDLLGRDAASLELAKRPHLLDAVAHRCVPRHDRVTGVPVTPRLRVQPEHRS